MYDFSYFKENDRARILNFIGAYPFAFLSGCDSKSNLVATQIPIVAELRNEELILKGHIMKNTDHFKAFVENPNALVVFTGPNAYVSASWYSDPQIGSTWNYMSVHANGSLTFMNETELVQFMKMLTLKFEEGNDRSPTVYDNLPSAFLDKMMPAIAGFEIKVNKLENVFKLSQNRDEISYLNIIAELEKKGGTNAQVAQEMLHRKDELFVPGTTWDPNKFDS